VASSLANRSRGGERTGPDAPLMGSLTDYRIWMITRCAETGLVPPAIGVIVRAVELPAGLRTVSTELMTVVVTRERILQSG